MFSIVSYLGYAKIQTLIEYQFPILCFEELEVSIMPYLLLLFGCNWLL